MKRLLALILSAVTLTAQAFDSSSAYNTITFSYVDNAFVGQNFVLSDAQKSSATSFKLTVDAKDGGGRPTHKLDGSCAAYCSQYDTAEIRIIAYNNSGAVLSTKSVVQNLKNWGSSSNPGWSVAPGDNQFDWTQMTVSVTAADVGGSFANVSRIRVELVNKNEGSYWNGNYGVQFRTPTLQVNGTGSNLLYNSEFGVDNTGVKAQGWAVSYSSYNSCSGTASNQVCVTVEPTVTANMWGGGYDPNGGTVNSQPGGYESVLTSDNADTAAEGGDITSGGGSSPPALCCGGSSDPFNANAANTAKVLSFTSRTSADSQVYIEQIGNMNTTVIDQSGTRNNYVYYYSDGSFNTVDITQSGNSSTAVNYTDLTVNGNHNDISVLQSSTGGGKGVFATVNNDYNTVNIQQKDSGNHYLSLTLTGGHKTVDVLQQGSAAHMASITLSGNPTELSLTQTGTAQQYYSITHNCTTAGGCGTIEVTQGN